MADTKADGAESGLNIHPMDQFVVQPLFGDGPLAWYTISNATLWFALAIVATVLLLVFGTRSRGMIPTRSQSVAEMIYGFVHKMVEDIAGKEGLKYFPYIMSIFIFVLVANVIGLLPYSFTTTSHLWVTASAPLALRPILFLIELISYFVRPVSHSIRLMGNMMAGHAVIKVFAGFAGAMGLGAVIPIFGIVAVYGLEMLVVVIQAYVFTILTCVYLNDALHPGH